MPLELELTAYRARLNELLESEGKFAVFVGDRLVGVFADYGDALRAGYQQVGANAPFLVKRIERFETPVPLRSTVA